MSGRRDQRRAGPVEAAAALDDAGTAAAAYRLLAPFAHLPMIASLGVTWFGSTRHALGVAALTTGDLDVAVRHLRAAVRDNWALGHFPAVALSRGRLAQALARRGAAGRAIPPRRGSSWEPPARTRLTWEWCCPRRSWPPPRTRRVRSRPPPAWSRAAGRAAGGGSSWAGAPGHRKPLTFVVAGL